MLILIEYFIEEKYIDRIKLIKSKYPHISIAVVLTEHMDLRQNNLWFHGTDLSVTDQYLSSSSKISRLIGMLKVAPYTDFFLTLMDLPVLEGFQKIFPRKRLFRIFPEKFIIPSQSFLDLYCPENDFIFFGSLTNYRIEVLEWLSERFKVEMENGFIDDAILGEKVLNARFVINIPQDKDWKWSSPMRLIKAWNLWRPVISFSKKLEGLFESAPLSYSNLDDDSVEGINAKLLVWNSEYCAQLNRANLLLDTMQ